MLKTPMVRSTLVALVSSVAFTAHAVADASKRIEVPAGELVVALETLSRQAAVDLVFRPDQLKSFRTEGVSGTYSPQDAIRILLKGTPFQLRTDASSGAMVIAPPAAPKSSSSLSLTEGEGSASAGERSKSFWSRLRLAQTDTPSPSQGEGRGEDREQAPAQPQERIELEEIVVTGTNIRGAVPVGSNLKAYTRKDLERSGAATVNQFARTMTENFANIDATTNSSAVYAPASFGRPVNAYRGAAFNIRGIGPSSTLTLVNGRRMPLAGYDGAFVDISLIPMSALDRIEVLADGASAIYGADAVAGVVNLITRRDFDGAETSVRYGASTDGGAEELTASQALGGNWKSGNAFVGYEYGNQDGLLVSDRDYLPDVGRPVHLIPEETRHSVFGTLSQSIGDTTDLYVDGTFARRRYAGDAASVFSFFEQVSQGKGEAEQAGFSVGVEQQLGGSWDVRANGTYAQLEQMDEQLTVVSFGGVATASTSTIENGSDILSTDVIASGLLFNGPGGAAKMAVGVGYREEGFDAEYVLAGTVNVALDRSVKSAFAEITIPLIGDANAVRGARGLELSFAGRYDDYSDFGSSFNPKAGILWSVIPGLSLRGTYGTSYRAPLLNQLGQPAQHAATFVSDPGAVGVPAGFTRTLVLGGGNPGLESEESESFTVGIDIRPVSIPRLSLEASYYDIRFDDRISVPSGSGGASSLADPLLAPFIIRNPSTVLVQSFFDQGLTFNFPNGAPASTVLAILDTRYANIAATRQRGIDLTARYSVPVASGQVAAALSAQRILENEVQTQTGQSYIELLNGYGQPAKWKGRGSVTWINQSYSFSAFLNYVNEYQNTLFAVSAPKIDSWLTFDVNLSYSTGDTAPALVRNLSVSLNVNNVFDERPPFAEVPTLLSEDTANMPFDSSNATAIGRLIALQFKKNW